MHIFFINLFVNQIEFILDLYIMTITIEIKNKKRKGKFFFKK